MLAVDVAGGSVRALMDVDVKSERERIKSARLCIIFSAVDCRPSGPRRDPVPNRQRDRAVTRRNAPGRRTSAYTCA